MFSKQPYSHRREQFPQGSARFVSAHPPPDHSPEKAIARAVRWFVETACATVLRSHVSRPRELLDVCPRTVSTTTARPLASSLRASTTRAIVSDDFHEWWQPAAERQ